MKTAAAPLTTFLNANTVGALAELYTLTLQSGAVARWTRSYADMVWDGFTFTASGSGTAPGVGRGSITETSGLDVGGLKLTLRAGDAALVDGVRLPLAAVTGRFNGARLKVQRAVLDAPGGTVQGVVTRFEGTVANVAPTSTGVELEVAPDTEALNREVPRHVYRPACNHTLFDAGCGVLRSSLVYPETAAAGSTTTVVQVGTSYPATLFPGGTITFTSGALAGLKRTIQSQPSGTSVKVTAPLPSAPALGVDLELTPGCNKSRSVCQSTFNNLTRFRGFPWVPPPEESA